MPRTKHVAVCVMATALAGCWSYDECPTASDLGVGRLPARLSETGLYADTAAGTFADGVVPFEPQFELWSDGAEKRRWILLPEGERIDTGDMDAWVFPAGTKLWKEFRRDGVRVETRLLQKLGPRDEHWVGVAYLWDADQGDAAAVSGGAKNALGTAHDVPDAGQCIGCHGGRKSHVLGFSAVQLSAPAGEGALDLEKLIATGRLTDPPAGAFDVPGDDTERAALGYLHANCAHCHNQERPDTDGPRCFDPRKDIDFQLYVDELGAVADTATYRTMDCCVSPREAEGSSLIERVSERDTRSAMPPLATEEVDDAGVNLLRRWIDGM